MAHTYEELSHMTVAQLREIALGIEGVTGATQMRKQQVLEAICQALNIDMRVHHQVVGINKRSIKKRIRALKVERDQALEARDSAELKRIRRQIHRIKRRIHRATV